MLATSTAAQLRALADAHSAHNYHPLPIVISSAEGAWMTDVEGRRYLDLLAAYSALNFGHRHPRLVAAAQRQLERATLVSRAFDHDQFGLFCAELAALAGMDMVLPMNTGAEAVETGIKTARKWGYEVKGVPAGQAVIVTFEGNFHGRTTTIVSFSTDDDARASYGPYTPGFRVVPYGDPAALAAAMDERVVGVLIEPIQGGSTFGGNPLACAVGREVIAMLSTGEFQERSAKLGTHLHDRLSALPREVVRQVRGRGLWAGVEFAALGGREVCERLAACGVLAKDTHGTAIRLAPPLVITQEDLDWGLDRLEEAVR